MQAHRVDVGRNGIGLGHVVLVPGRIEPHVVILRAAACSATIERSARVVRRVPGDGRSLGCFGSVEITS
jgi:hypothetical protein